MLARCGVRSAKDERFRHILDRIVGLFPSAQGTMGAADTILCSVQLNGIARLGFCVLQRIAQTCIVKGIFIIGKIERAGVRVQVAVKARHISKAARLGLAVDHVRPRACVCIVCHLRFPQNGVLRGLGGCLCQQLQPGIQTGLVCRGRGGCGRQSVQQGCFGFCCCGLDRNRAAGALTACHSRNGAAARLAGRHSAVYHGGDPGRGHRPDDAFIGGVRRQHGGGQGLALALVQGQGAAAQAYALYRNLVTATAAAAPLGAQGVQLRLHGGAGVGGVFQKGKQQGLAGLAQTGARIRIFSSFCNAILHVIQLRSGKHFAVCKVLFLITH